MRTTLLAGLILAALGGGAMAATPASRFTQDPYPSTYRAIPAAPVLLANATVLTGTGERLDGADVLLADGKVAAVLAKLGASDGSNTEVSGRDIAEGDKIISGERAATGTK